jgi:hypothetical protein
MATTIVKLTGGDEIYVMTTPTLQGMSASGILFAPDAETIAETDSRQYIGYCRGCVVQSVVSDLEPYTDRKDIHVSYDCACA